MSEPTRLRRWLSVGRAVFGPLALAFMVFAVWNGRDVAGELITQVNPWLLVFLAMAWAGLNTLTPLATAMVLRGMGAEIGYATALRIHLQRLPARYLPGGIWHTVSRVVDLKRLGVGNAQLSSLVLVENVLPLGTAVLLGASLAALSSGHRIPVVALMATGTLLLLALPWLLRRAPFRGEQPLAPSALAGAIAVFFVFWLLAASLFAAYWWALQVPGAGAGWLLPATIYLLAWSAGFVAVVAPQGIGVFEAAAGWMLQGDAPFTTMALLVAGYRLVTLAGDLTAYAGLRLADRLGLAAGKGVN